MKDNKKLFQIYTIVWIVFFLVLVATLFRMYGDEHIINYTGIVRGCTQKVILGETQGIEDDELIAYVDQVIYDLQSAEEYSSFDLQDTYYQEQLIYIDDLWCQIKEEIEVIRLEGSSNDIYTISLLHYEISDDLAHYVEDTSAKELSEFFYLFGISFGFAIVLLISLFYHNRNNLNKIAMKDSLTNIYSRDGFSKQSKHLLQNSSKEQYVVLAIDIVDFKIYNHRLGHSFGDEILCLIASCLEEFVGQNGICSRINGDNFKVFIIKRDHMIEDINTYIVEKMREKGFLMLAKDIHFIYSAYEIIDNTEEIEEILGKVNLAHSYAKIMNAREVVWYDSSFINQVQQEDDYTSRFNEAIVNKEFKIYLQPQLNLETMQINAAEALVRWEVEEGKIIFPDSFIPLYEGKGLIPLLDYYILEEVCSYLQEIMLEHQTFSIAINFSRLTLSTDHFVTSFLEIVEKYGIDASCIEIEITETSLNELSNEVIEQLEILSNKGFKIAMDDFGAGFSNLCSLTDIPLNILKLDKQFLWKMDSSGSVSEIIESVVKMAHNLDLKVICEGVETKKHLSYLRTVGCDIAQGYFISRAIPTKEFTEKYLSTKK
ncbi:putative bifunctional diguanylate cyclase/phosphodiesterase [Tannockella kyphosi]|uniref:putative bifunctional diguanylate cyclase/phosphodiesterase n=1 Tax=Tannockella kyphosi TaxID=2899121 RepID=UPI0020122506|nr:bifunctional diguanylate cyclase/phosphodiesterase [Tannockella kyphosi]